MWHSEYIRCIFNAIYTKEENGYSVLCVELGVASQGADMKEAELNIKKAVELFIKDIPKDELEPYTHNHLGTPLLKTLEVFYF